MSFVAFDKGKVKRVLLDPIRKALRAGLLPLLHGDLVFDESRGIGVLSGDRLASLIGLRLGASRVLLGCDVDGVYSENPKTLPSATLIPEVTSENFRLVLDASRGPRVMRLAVWERRLDRLCGLPRMGGSVTFST